MRRLHLFEIHDHPRFPAFLRNLVTDALQATWDHSDVYRPIVPMLLHSVEACENKRVVDLCSGGGGPWLRLLREVAPAGNLSFKICLTDLYPNLQAFEQARATTAGHIVYSPASVDATQVPADLEGFRTMFSSFHHFSPEVARRILGNAIASQDGIGIFEAAKRSPRTMLLVFGVPLLALAFTPLIRPFRWARLFWTYLIPVVPFVLWFDGLVSCLRTYSQEEMRELAAGIPGAKWEIGETTSGLVPVTYLIGMPLGTISGDE